MSKAIRFAEAELEQIKARQRGKSGAGRTNAGAVGGSAAEQALRRQTARERFQALGRLKPGTMNKTEAAYAELLEADKQAGKVIDWKFHPMNVRLAPGTFYEVDFMVLEADMRVSIREVKGGFTTEKGQMKIKLCAQALPWFQFLKVEKQTKKDGGGWKVTEY